MHYLDYNFNDSPESLSAFDELPLWSAPFGLFMLKNIKLKPNITLVDIGSGAGFPLIEIAERLGKTSKCFGLDPWKNANDRARQKTANYGLHNVEIIEGSAEEMPFENDSIDVIISNLGIHNIDHPDKAIKECFRVLKPGGKLVITTNLYGQWRIFYSIFEETLRELGKNELIAGMNAHEQARGTAEGFFNLLTNNGFKVTNSFTDEFDMRYLDGSAFLNHHFIKLGFLSTWKTIIPAADWKVVFGKLETNLNNYAKDHGELRMSVPMFYIEGEK
jgi:arsenite methyltransferase